MESIILHKPEAGRSAEICVSPEQTYQLTFHVETANFERMNGDAVFAFDDGAMLRLKNFFPAISIGDFTIELPDGIQLSAKDMVEVFEADLRDFNPSCSDQAYDPSWEIEAAAIFYPTTTSIEPKNRVGQFADQPGGLLQIEDILTTAHSEIFDSPCAPSAPAFESLLDAPEAAPEWSVCPAGCNSQTDGENQFILAVLGFGLL